MPAARLPAAAAAAALALSSLLLPPPLARAAPATAFASTPVQVDWAHGYSFWFDPALPLGRDADVVALHDDYYGVPWAWLLSGGAAPPPVTWLSRLNASVAAAAAWGRPVFLSLQMLTGPLRTCPASNATDDGGAPGAPGAVTPFAGCAQCWDFDPRGANPAAAPVQAAFSAYVAVTVQAFAQGGVTLVGLNFAPEINLGARLCGDAWWAGVVAFSNGVYAAAKAALAGVGWAAVPAFPSIQLEVVLGLQTGPDQPCVGMVGAPSPPPAVLACIDAGLAQVAPLAKDLFAVSTYPYGASAGLTPGLPRWQPWYIPAVLGRMAAADAANFSIAETGWLTAPLVVNLANGTVGSDGSGGDGSPDDPPPQCASLLATNATDADGWLAYLVGLASEHGWPLVNWWSNTDLLAAAVMGSCPCDAGAPGAAPSCAFVSAYREVIAATGGVAWGGELDAKAFGTMGVRALVGGAPVQPLYDTLQAARAAGGPWVPRPLGAPLPAVVPSAP